MIKIAIFIESLAAGGAEKALTLLAENIDKSRFDLTVISETSGEFYSDRVAAACRLKTFAKSCGPEDFWQYKLNRVIYRLFNTLPRRLLHRFVIGRGYDIEVAFCEGFATRLIANSSNKKSKKIAFVHTDFAVNHWSLVHYKNFAEEEESYNKFDAVSCVSQSVALSFKELFGLDEKVFVNYNPIDTAPVLSLAREELILPKTGGLRFVTAGRLVEVKGYSRLLKIAKELRDEGFLFELIILGTGQLEEALKAYIEEEALGDCVKLLGFKANPYPYFANSDCFVCSSYAEGFNTALAESLILGIPIISTDCAGAAEAFGGLECGIICPNNDKALKEALKSVLEKPDRLEVFKKACRQRSGFFDLNNNIKKIEDMFLRVL